MYVTSPMQIGTGRVDPDDFTRGPVDLGGELTLGGLDITNESQEVSTFPAGDHMASINRRA